jgi:beta-xylosidase
MWAPDAATKGGKYYFYFPAMKADDIFQIGVVVSGHPEGPFTALPSPIKQSYSIDPAVFEDDNGHHYMYFGGIWGGQLQHYRDNVYSAGQQEPMDDEPALGPIFARLDETMLEFAETPREIKIVDENIA